MVEREDVVAWAARNYGPRHAEQRVSEQPAAFVIDTSSDAVLDGHERPGYGGVSIVVRKLSGGYWQVGHDPVSHSVYLAANDRDLRHAMKTAGLDPARPQGTIPEAGPAATSVTRDTVAAWGRRAHRLDDAEERVVEGQHAFLIYLASADHYGGATALVSKRTGEYWMLGSYADFDALVNADSDDELRVAMAAWAERPSGTLAPAVTRDQVVSWLAERSGWRHLDARITDLGWMFLVNTQPDDFLDGLGPQDPAAGPIVVVKGSGAAWWLPLSPDVTRAVGAANAQEFHQEMARAGHPLPAEPHEWLIERPELPKPELTRERVTGWLAEQYGWRHLDDRITDKGWAFSVNTQPDDYLDGDESAMTIGNGPMFILKRTGAVWALPSHPGMIPVFSARDEADFQHLMRRAMPVYDKDRPNFWLRP